MNYMDDIIMDTESDYPPLSRDRHLLCVWKQMSYDKNSTTFQAVNQDNKEHPLYKCKYKCSGTEVNDCYIHREIGRSNYERD